MKCIELASRELTCEKKLVGLEPNLKLKAAVTQYI